MGIFKGFLRKRKIKEVSSWSGSASNYSTPQAFAKASLINFNPVAGNTNPDEWTKSLIKLPVRNEGDSQGTYIKQAVQAAAGGRGITRVKKPADVSQEDFDRLRKKAANQIISAYKQWGGTAPDSVYKIAGKERPMERAVSFEKIYAEVEKLVYLADAAEEKFTRLYEIFYDESVGRFFVLGLRDGMMYKIEVVPSGDDIMLGDFYPIDAQDMIPRAKDNKFSVYRSKNDEMRWLAIASVAVLNRVGEIDSRELFDSFIDFAERTGIYPNLTVYHLGDGSEIGEADFLARDNFVYIASGTFHNNEVGRKFYRALQNRDDWGNSIEFFAPNSHVENFEFEGTTIQVPVYKRGINTSITLVQEADAASVFTLHKSKRG